MRLYLIILRDTLSFSPHSKIREITIAMKYSLMPSKLCRYRQCFCSFEYLRSSLKAVPIFSRCPICFTFGVNFNIIIRKICKRLVFQNQLNCDKGEIETLQKHVTKLSFKFNEKSENAII